MLRKKVVDNIVGKPIMSEERVKSVVGNVNFDGSSVKPIVGIKKPKDDFWTKNYKK